MAITASSILSSATLEEFRQEYNKLVSDVSTIEDKNAFSTQISFEGATADDYETILTVDDPTADRTITLPDETGTVLTSASTISATNITISANNSADETVYPIFVDGATGSQGLESDTGLTYNPSSGLLTATIFSGYLKQADDTYSLYGSDSDIKVGYDETTNDAFVIGANVEGAALKLHLYADQADDNADEWLWQIADGGDITWQSKTGGSFATKLTLTADGNMTVAGNLTVSGTTTTVNSTVTTIVDPIVVLQAASGGGALASDTNKDVGLAMQWYSGSAKTAFLGFDDSVGALTFIKDATISSEVVSGTAGEMIVGDISANNGIVADTFGTIILSGTNAASANAGSDLVLDSSAASTDVGERLVFECGTISLHADPGHESGTFVISDKVKLNGGAGISGDDTLQVEDGEGGILFEDATNDVLVFDDLYTIKKAGKETIWVPASAMYPTTTSGCADLTQVEGTAGRPELKCLDFDPSSDENAQFSVAFPKSWNESTITFKAFFTVSGTNTGTVAWVLSGVAFADNDAIDTAFGTAVSTPPKAHSGTSGDLDVTAESSAVTISGSPSTNEQVYFNVLRDVSADNQSGDARLLGIQLFFTTNAANDI